MKNPAVLVLLLILSPGLVAQTSARTAEPLHLSDEEGASHALGKHAAVRVASQQKSFTVNGHVFNMNSLPHENIPVSLTIDEAGNVVAVDSKAESDYLTQALAAAKDWRFSPFMQEGHPVRVSFNADVEILPTEILPAKHVAFPNVKAHQPVVMELSRSGCYGACPAYKVQVHRNGDVIFLGAGDVAVPGEHRDHIPAAAAEKLLNDFEKADFFSLEDNYAASVTDMPTYQLVFIAGDVKKIVTDYLGEWVGMPQSVTDLELEVDAVAGTERWVKTNSETVASLQREGWDAKSKDASMVLARAAEAGNANAVHGLLAMGVDASAKVPTNKLMTFNNPGTSSLVAAARSGSIDTLRDLIGANAGANSAEQKNSALAAAAGRGDLPAMRALIDYGAEPTASAPQGTTILMAAADSGVPAAVAEILQYRPDVNARNKKGETALFGATTWGNNDEENHADRAAVVRLLVKAGADVNARNEEGNTPLHETFEEAAARELIAGGADVNARNGDGETPIFTTVSQEIAQMLIDAGADLSVLNDAGENVVDASSNRSVALKEMFENAVAAKKR